MKDIKFKKEDMLELNVANLNEILAKCQAPAGTPNHLLKMCGFADESHGGKYSSLKLPCIKSELKKHKEKIRYMLGQLKVLHDDKALMELLQGNIKFDGTDWTLSEVPHIDDPEAQKKEINKSSSRLMFLYMLGCGCNLIPPFEFNGKGQLVCSIQRYEELIPTTSPKNDEHLVKDDGYEPADN